MKVAILTLCLLFTATSGFGQNNELPKREAFELNIAVDDSNFYSAKIGATAFVLPDNTIQLYPGETVFIEVVLTKKGISSMKSVKENLHPDKTIVISFTQHAEGKIHKGMMLKIENPFEQTLEYKAFMFLMKNNKWVSTSTVPVQPKLSSYETWPDIIVTIGLSGWVFK